MLHVAAGDPFVIVASTVASIGTAKKRYDRDESATSYLGDFGPGPIIYSFGK